MKHKKTKIKIASTTICSECKQNAKILKIDDMFMCGDISALFLIYKCDCGHKQSVVVPVELI